MITRDGFIERLSQKGYTKRDAGVIMDDFIQTLEEALIQGESVLFRGFGTFEVHERAEKRVKNPQTKELMVVPSYRCAHFSPGQLLKRKVKAGTANG